MALAARHLKVAVVDIDLSGRLSSSEKNAGGVRATWWQPVNIALCRASIDYYRSVRDEVGFRQKGYLWLYDDRAWIGASEHLTLQRSLGQPIEVLTPAQAHARVPEIDKLDGIAGVTFSPEDGLINPNLLKEHYRSRSREAGAVYLDRVYVHAATIDSDEVRLQCWKSSDALSDEALVRLMSEDGRGEPQAGALFELRGGTVAITTGAWSDNALRLFGLRNYSEPVRRQLCLVDNRESNFAAYGMIVDTSGLYFHNEGAHILAGYSPPDTPPGHHFNYDGEPFFLDDLASDVRADELLRAPSPYNRMGWAVRSQSRPQRDTRTGGAAYRRGSFIQRTRRDAIVRRRPGVGRVGRRWPLQPIRRLGAVARAVRARRAGHRGVAHLRDRGSPGITS